MNFSILIPAGCTENLDFPSETPGARFSKAPETFRALKAMADKRPVS